MLEHHTCKSIPFHEGLIEFCLLVSTRRLLMHVSKSVTERSPPEPSQCPRNHNTWNSRFSPSPLSCYESRKSWSFIMLNPSGWCHSFWGQPMMPLASISVAPFGHRVTPSPRPPLSFLTAAISHSVASVNAKAWEWWLWMTWKRWIPWQVIESSWLAAGPSGWIHGISPPMISSC